LIDVVADADVALKWFHGLGEKDVEPSRALLDHQRRGAVLLHVLDLTFYEVGNALLRGAARATVAQATTVLGALREICVVVTAGAEDVELAATFAAEHGLTMYDAAYAAVARGRSAQLASFDRELLGAGLAVRPGDLVARLRSGGAPAS
jgi:predicted nucleic acid-binding protein